MPHTLSDSKIYKEGQPYVVLVEDEKTTRNLLESKISNMISGVFFRRFSSATEAWKFVKRDASQIDLVVTDINLEGEVQTFTVSDGLWLLEVIRDETSTEDLPVVIMSSEGSKENKRAARERRVSVFIEKRPDNFDLMAEVCAECIRQSQLLRKSKNALKELQQAVGLRDTSVKMQAEHEYRLIPLKELAEIRATIEAISLLSSDLKNTAASLRDE